MQEEFEAKVNEKTYLLKRMFLEGLPLTYHIHIAESYRHLIFRMRLMDGAWQLLPQLLPSYVIRDAGALAEEIKRNEALRGGNP
ncbi:MAG: hypothetical protein JWP69_1317 [Flaviaesturariibacter sp.]|nr:hypothetical protein [Flaviaesturariibacter sp.]